MSRGSSERAHLHAKCGPKDNDEVAHQKLRSTFAISLKKGRRSQDSELTVFDCATPGLAETGRSLCTRRNPIWEKKARGSRERAPVHVICGLKDSEELAHQ